jgi:YVTN family beta-propeller protein
VIDGTSNSVIKTIPVGYSPLALIYNSASDKIYSANGSSYNLTVIDGEDDSVITTIPVGDLPNALAYNPTNNKKGYNNQDY